MYQFCVIVVCTSCMYYLYVLVTFVYTGGIYKLFVLDIYTSCMHYLYVLYFCVCTRYMYYL